MPSLVRRQWRRLALYLQGKQGQVNGGGQQLITTLKSERRAGLPNGESRLLTQTLLPCCCSSASGAGCRAHRMVLLVRNLDMVGRGWAARHTAVSMRRGLPMAAACHKR